MQTLTLQPVGELSNTPSGLTMAWFGDELPPGKNGVHKLDGKYCGSFTGLPAAPDALLKSFVYNCKTGCNTSICTCLKSMHGYVCCMPGLDQQNTEPPISMDIYKSVSKC